MTDDNKVIVLTTGGTIASLPDKTKGGVVAAIPGDELIAAIPALRQVSPIEAREVMQVGSYLITPEKMLEIARAVREAAGRPDVKGIVVTHGTDTMEETAYLVDLLYSGEKPVVFTGAQRYAGSPYADGPGNLIDAVRIAGSPAARGLGAVITMGGGISGSREATKLHTYALRAFGTHEQGYIGEVIEDEVHIFHPRVRPANLWEIDSIEPRVSLIKLVAGIDGSFVRTAVKDGAKGIVLEALGLGNANYEVLKAVKEAISAGTVVVVVSRCPSGTVAPVYGAGGGYDLAQSGAIFGGNLSGQKARVLLMAALAAARELGRPAEEFLTPHLTL